MKLQVLVGLLEKRERNIFWNIFFVGRKLGFLQTSGHLAFKGSGDFPGFSNWCKTPIEKKTTHTESLQNRNNKSKGTMCVKNASKKSCGKTSYQKKHHTFSKHFNWSSWGAKNFCWIHRFLTENAPWTCAWAADHGCILRIPWPRTSCGGIYRRRLPLTFDASGS